VACAGRLSMPWGRRDGTFLSGTAKKKLGLTVERVTEDGRISYRIPSVPAEG
jgi:hypothetical protein